MSKFNLLKSIAVVALGIAAGYFSVHLLKPASANRFIASQQISKLGLSNNAASLFDVKLNTDGLALRDSDMSIITVSVVAANDLPDAGITYKWNLPSDVQLLDGTAASTIGAFSAGQSKDFTIKVKNFSKELRKYISFEVQGDLNQLPLKREVLISSRIEDSFEYMLQQNELKKNKLNKKLGVSENKGRFSPENIIH
jgi:hypothetical protein